MSCTDTDTDTDTDTAIGTDTAAVVPADAIALPGSRTLRFEGRDHGSGISFFLVDNAPGQGADPHRQPCGETWTVLDGEATTTVGDRVVVARTGDTVVVGPDTWHGFTCTCTGTGTGRLRMMCVHASAEIVQEWRDA